MAHAPQRPAKTVEDYLALPDDIRAELIRGELLVTPSPSTPHQEVIGALHAFLRAFVGARGLGRVLLSPLDVHLPTGDVVQPDLVFVAREHEEILQQWVHGVPDLLVEVVSPSHPERDRLLKRDLYAANGVGEYWLVDLSERSVEVLRLEGASYRAVAYARRDEAFVSPSLPGLRVEVAPLFADV